MRVCSMCCLSCSKAAWGRQTCSRTEVWEVTTDGRSGSALCVLFVTAGAASLCEWVGEMGSLSLSLSPSPQGCARMQSLPARSVYVCVSVCCMLCMCDFNNVRSVREFILHVSRLFLCLLLPVVRSLCTQANPRRYLWFIAEGEFCCFHWSVHTWGKETMRETERERESERDGECICGEKRRITSKKQHSRWPVAELQVPFYYCITCAACACMREEKVVCVCDRREPHLLSVALTYLLVTRFFATVTFVTLAIYIVLCRVANSAYER